jgi:RNase P/RNase MRP subunit p29
MSVIRPRALLFPFAFLPTFPLGLSKLDKVLRESAKEVTVKRRKVMFTKIKAAMQVGFRERKGWEYGGEEITVKGRLLVRNPIEAVSKTEWSKRGYRVRQDAQPHCYRSIHFTGRGSVTYAVYRDDQVESKRRVSLMPPTLIDALSAVWAINRRAKRCHDLASSHYKSGTHGFSAMVKNEKLELYRLKGQALHYLRKQRRLETAGYHRFPSGNWAEVLEGGGYTFHRPCPDRSDETAKEIDEIEAKPRGSKEPRLKDALHTIKVYLGGKPEVDVFEWPQTRSSRGHWPEDYDFDDEYEDGD